MKILHVFLPLGLLSYLPAKKCGSDPISAAILGSSGISAGAGLVSGLFGYGANESNVEMTMAENEKNRQWQSAEADKARQWNREEWNRQNKIQMANWYSQLYSQENSAKELMDTQSQLQLSNWQKQYDIQNAYNSPSAQVQRLRAAGLNPALVLGGSGASGMMSAPSAPMPSASSPSPSVPQPSVSSVLAGTPQTSTPHREVTWATQLLGTIADASEKLMKAGVNRTVVEQNQRTMESFVKKAQNDVEVQELMKKSMSISNYISERTKDFKVGKEYGELQKLWKEMTFIGSQIEVNRVLKDNYEADTDLKKMQEVLAQMQSNKAFQESELLSFQVSTYFEDFTNRQNLYKAQANAANASATESYSMARLNDAKKLTEDLIRIPKVWGQQIINSLGRGEMKLQEIRQKLENVRLSKEEASKVALELERERARSIIENRQNDPAFKLLDDLIYEVKDIFHVGVGYVTGDKKYPFSVHRHRYNGNGDSVYDDEYFNYDR